MVVSRRSGGVTTTGHRLFFFFPHNTLVWASAPTPTNREVILGNNNNHHPHPTATSIQALAPAFFFCTHHHRHWLEKALLGFIFGNEGGMTWHHLFFKALALGLGWVSIFWATDLGREVILPCGVFFFFFHSGWHFASLALGILDSLQWLRRFSFPFVQISSLHNQSKIKGRAKFLMLSLVLFSSLNSHDNCFVTVYVPLIISGNSMAVKTVTLVLISSVMETSRGITIMLVRNTFVKTSSS